MRIKITLVSFVLICWGFIGCDQLTSSKNPQPKVENTRKEHRIFIKEISSDLMQKGGNSNHIQSVNSTGKLWRYPAEEKRWIQMAPDTAYARDVMAGGETSITDAVDGETWNVHFVLPSDSSIIIGDPIKFYDSYSEKKNCFVSTGFVRCGTRSLLVLWYVRVQGGPSGEWDMHFLNNGDPYAVKNFYIKPQIPPGKVPSGAAYNQGTFSTQHYDGICKGPLKANGKYEAVPCSDKYPEIYTIQRKGCYLTDAAMILAYHGVDVTVPELNTWLINNDGYDSKGNVFPGKVAEYGRKVGQKNISWIGNTNVGDLAKLRQLIFNYGPQIIGTKLVVSRKTGKKVPTHWVAATGENLDETTLLINDPDGGSLTTIDDKYSNSWSRIRAFSGPEYTVTDNSGITIRFHSPGELVLTNPQGKRVGFDPINGTHYDEIPQAGYSEQGLVDDYPSSEADTDPTLYHEIAIRQPVDGDYNLQVIGTGTGTYTLDLLAMGSNFADTYKDFRDVTIEPGVVHSYQFSFAKQSGGQTSIEGGFDGKGQRPRDVNKFLTFASPSQAQTTLPHGTSGYAIHVFYGKSIIPNSFKAELNRKDISGQFNPQPGTDEIVNLGLSAGRNVVKLSIDGQLPKRTANDTDRLVLKVE